LKSARYATLSLLFYVIGQGSFWQCKQRCVSWDDIRRWQS